MFAIPFDLVVKDTAEHNQKGIPAAYAEIGGYSRSSLDFAACKVVFKSAKTKTWQI
jgi:hypothetical protein